MFRVNRIVLVLLVTGVLLAVAMPALAHFFTGSGRYADTSTHTWWDGWESEPGELAIWGPYVEDSMYDEYHDRTDLVVSKFAYHYNSSYTYPYTDFSWGAINLPTPKGGDAVCNAGFLSNNRCDHFHIQFDNDPASEQVRRSAVCHEIGHTVGFDDGATWSGGCIGIGSQYTLHSYEIYHINSRY